MYSFGYSNEIQLQYFKKLLNLLHSSHNYAIRLLEIVVSHLELKVFKNIIGWLIKISKLSDTRYKKLCFLKHSSVAKKK